MYLIADDRCLGYESPGHPERPERVRGTVSQLQETSRFEAQWQAPAPVDDALLLRVHSEAHIARLAEARDFDADTPHFSGIDDIARLAVGGAVTAMERALQGAPAISLMRPPGHHACPERVMGFCYMNQIAVAAKEAASRGLKVAVFDFDVHHGNGTESALAGDESCRYFSVHQYPAYPGTGGHDQGNSRNFPMRPESARGVYVDALTRCFDALLEEKPDLIAVSAGFDAYAGDPLAQQRVEAEDYEALGQALRDCGIPSFAVLEGGYSRELPLLVEAFLSGWDQRGDD